MEITKLKQYPGTPFTLEIKQVKNNPGTWDSNACKIYRNNHMIGEYFRNYPSNCFETFYPFKKDDQWYALYSANYTSTRVMKLNENNIEDWCGEEPKENGFCPGEYYVPMVRKISYGNSFFYNIDNEFQSYNHFIEPVESSELVYETYTDFAFLAGCHWGDDSNYKLRFIDLTEVENKKIEIAEIFGRVELPNSLKLNQCVDLSDYEDDNNFSIKIIQEKYYSINKK